MKVFNKLLTLIAVAFLFMLMAPHKSMAQDGGYVSDQEFYDNLQDYGTWVYDEQFGNVWVPDVDGDFRPYATNGYWVQTDYGTTWVSDYPWGWATFHYGRWRFDDYYGWEWIPGHQWAPAWVSWRQGGGYYSWAPMQPGISINISFGGGYHVPDNYWVCAPQAYITSRYINRYYAPPTRVTYIIHNTTYIHNTYVYNNNTYVVGPRPADIERVTHKPVTIYKINNADKPGTAKFGGKSINIYRPAIHRTAGAMPVRVVNAKAYKQAHPSDGIGKPGVAANMHINAAKLAAVAHTKKPDNNIVRINPGPVIKAQQPTAKANTPAQVTHTSVSGGHKNIGPVSVSAQQAPAAANVHPRRVAPAVMPPADHHDPTERQPVTNANAAPHQKAQAAQVAAQARQQQQKAQQAAIQQQKQQAAQARQQAQQQAKQQQQAAMQQQKQQAAQAAAQARQQAQQQAKQQQQAAMQQQKQQAAQAAAQARQQAQRQAKQQAAQKAAMEAAKKQQHQQKQQPPPGN
jgi:hypothetical protein